MVNERIAEAEQIPGRHGVLQSCHRRLRTQIRIILRVATDRGLQRRVPSKMIAVVGILVAAVNLIGALAKQFGQMMENVALAARIVNRLHQSIHQTDLLVNFPHVQYAAVGADARLIETGRDFLAF